MKTLIRKKQKETQKKVALCCAKTSSMVPGCHD